MAKKALEHLKEKLESARRSLRNKGKDASPTSKAVAVIAGAAIGGVVPPMVWTTQTEADRNMQRYVRIGAGLVLIFAGRKLHALAPYFGAGVIAAEAAASAIAATAPGGYFAPATTVNTALLPAASTTGEGGGIRVPEYDFRPVEEKRAS